MSYALLAHSETNGTVGGALTAAGADNTFGKATLDTELSDSDGIVTLGGSDTWTHAATGVYRIDAIVTVGFDSALNGVYARAGLYNVTAAAFVTNTGGAVEIIGSATATGDPVNTAGGNAQIQIKGRYTVSSTSDEYAIYVAGKSTAGTWYSQTFAQGTAASAVTTGSKPEYYKLVEIIQE